MQTWISRLARSARRQTRRPASAPAVDARPAVDALMEDLESRLQLYASPFLANLPVLSDMADPRNTVVRLQMSEGNVDIELFDVAGPTPSATPAPRAAANFLSYVNSGRYDNTFFHRLVSGFVLQGGGFGLKDPIPTAPPRFDTVRADAPLVNEFSSTRSNIERTLAFARLGGNVNSATSQFFFNLANNASNLDVQGGAGQGFTVFGRVIKGWSVVTTIAGFSTRNLNNYLDGSTGTVQAFNETPLRGTNDSDVVSILDAEVIKLANTNSFFSSNVFYSDGFRAVSVTADVALVNTDPNNAATFQIIARYESGIRDGIVLTGTLEPGASRNVRVSQGNVPSLNRVRGGVGFSYEIRSTRPLAAQWSQFDFGAVSNASMITAASLTDTNLKDWTFAAGQKGQGLPSFLTWNNISNQPVTVNVLFTSETGQQFFIAKTTQPYRRGGLDVNQLSGVPEGQYSVRIVSTQPIVAAMSQFRFAPARTTTETGQLGGPSTKGVITAATLPTSGQSILAFTASAGFTSPLTIDVDFVLTDGSIVAGANQILLTTTNPRREADVATLAPSLPRDTPFTIRYKVRDNAAPVWGAVTTISPSAVFRQSFQSVATQTVYFAGGFLNPDLTSDTETISIYNPYAADRNATFTYRLKFHFLSGPGEEVIVPTGGQGTLAAQKRVDIRVRDLSEVLARVSSGIQFRRYAVSIEASITQSSIPQQGSVYASLTRTGSGGNFVTSAALDQAQFPFPITDTRFGT